MSNAYGECSVTGEGDDAVISCVCVPGACARPGEALCQPAHVGFTVERALFITFYSFFIIYFAYLTFRRLKEQGWRLKFNNTQTVFHTCGLFIAILAIPGTVDAHSIWKTAGGNFLLIYFVVVANDTLIDIACMTYVHIVASSLDWAEIVMSRERRAKILISISVAFGVTVHLGVFIYALTLNGYIAVVINFLLVARSLITCAALFHVYRNLLQFADEAKGAIHERIQKSIRKWSIFTFLCVATLLYVIAATAMWIVFHLGVAPSLTPNCVDYDDPLASSEVYAWAFYVVMLAAFSKADHDRDNSKTGTKCGSYTSSAMMSGGTQNSQFAPSKGSMQVDCALLKTISTVDTQTADGSDDDIGPSCKLQESLADREDVEVTITDTNTNESGSGSNMNTSRSKENLSVLQQIELTGK